MIFRGWNGHFGNPQNNRNEVRDVTILNQESNHDVKVQLETE